MSYIVNANIERPEKLAGLSSYSWDHLDFLWNYYFTGDPYYKAIDVLKDRINYNKGITCYPFTSGSECYQYDEIDHIIKSYMNAVLESSAPIPEYDRKFNPSKIDYIENEVARRSGRPVMRVKIVLYNAYWMVYGRPQQIDNNLMIQPKSYLQTIEQNGQHPAQVQEYLNQHQQLSPINQIVDTAKWILYIGLGVIVIGGVAYLVTNGKGLLDAIKGR